MKRSTLVLFPLVLLLLASCAKKENDAVTPRRLPEDTIHLSTLLENEDPEQLKSEFDLWLQYYPNEINRVFPEQGTSALGLVSQKYFLAAPESKGLWSAMMDELLARGANPNIFFPYREQRRGLLHVALEGGEIGLVRTLIERQGTVDPPLVLSCDAPSQFAQRAPAARVPSTAIDLNLQEEVNGLTPLHYAVMSSRPDQDFIEYLLLQGASPDIADQSLNLVSPLQMVAGNPQLSTVFEKYSGAQIRYESRMNSFLNDEIIKAPSDRMTVLDLAQSYRDMVEKEGFQEVQDINRVIEMCQSKEKINLLGYVAQYLMPSTSTKLVIAVKARNDSVKSLIADYGARICVPESLSIKDSASQSFREIALKDFIKVTLATHSLAANAPVQTFNRSLWCEIIKPKAVEDGCWIEETDANLAPGIDCPAG